MSSEAPTILIYTHRITPRVPYVFRVLLSEMLGLDVRVTDSKETFNEEAGPKLSYAHQPVGDELHFSAHGLLHEKGVNEQTIQVQERNGIASFFSVTSQRSALPFDVFSAAFFLLSRYEECLPHVRDKYDRFEATESIAYKHGFLTTPVVDHWALELKDVLSQHFPELEWKPRSYRFISTIDVDNAFAYRHKGLMRTLGAYARSLLNGDLTDLKDRTLVFLGRKNDPYDTYDFQLEIQRRYGLETIYFFLLADYGVNDKNVPHYDQQFRRLIKHLADHAKVGIHPGFNSNRDERKLKTEKKRLENIVHTHVTRSRQHFLILHLPHTYQRLIRHDILEDHSMGYAAHIGFRAGTCTPYRFYDLDLETPTELTVYPFAMMEATLKYYMELDPERAKKEVTAIIDKVKEVNGTFISLWHNETLSDEGIWEGWRGVFHHMVKEATASGSHS